MKVAMIGQKGIPARSGGIERHVEELSIELAKRGHEVLVFCRPWMDRFTPHYRGIRCIQTFSIHRKNLDCITHTFTSIIRAAQEKVDIFHFHGVGPALLAWLPKILRPSAKVIVTFHCIDRQHQKWHWFARTMLRLGEWCAARLPDTTVVVSKTLQTYCWLSYEAEAAHIPNGTRIPDEPSDLTLLSAFDLQPGKYLMMCSRIVRHKGQHELIAAWQRLQKERPDLLKEKKLAIVGGPAFTDDYAEEIYRQAAHDESIVFTGVQTGEVLHALFEGSYGAVHPSASEGLPLAILEAMAYGKTVLSSDIPESMEVIKNHGLSYRLHDENDMVEKLAALLESPDLVRSVGAEARAFVSLNYDWNQIGLQTHYLYESLYFQPELQEAI